jgi:hypothetical protein
MLVQDIVQVTRLRISHLGIRIHDKLQVIGEPVAFAQRLASLEPVRGLPIDLPFGDAFPVDTQFWSRIAERRLTAPMTEDCTAKLRRAGIPLRYGGALEAAAEAPRLEAHLHPFGVVAMTTVDLRWPDPVPLEEVWQPVRQLEDEPATVTVGGVKSATTLGQAAARAAQDLITLLTDPGQGDNWELPPHRLATVISGVVNEQPTAMPAANSPMHLALHQLSAGNEVVAEPSTAFVAQWSGAGYTWPPASLVYMLDRGTSVFSAGATGAAPVDQKTAERHREQLLLLAYLAASTGLVRAARTSSSDLLSEWAKTAAKRLGVLFGPGQAYLDWGLLPRALLLRTGTDEDVALVLGAPLTANPKYPVPDYG